MTGPPLLKTPDARRQMNPSSEGLAKLQLDTVAPSRLIDEKRHQLGWSEAGRSGDDSSSRVSDRCAN